MVALVPLMSRSFYNVVTQFLIALSVGSLTGDAFLHLIPHVSSDFSLILLNAESRSTTFFECFCNTQGEIQSK